MLIVSRNVMERIEVGEDVFVTLLEIRGSRVRIGMDAPQKLHLRRAELKNVISQLPTDDVPAPVASIDA